MSSNIQGRLTGYISLKTRGTGDSLAEFNNVMQQLVLSETLARVAEIEAASEIILDVAAIAICVLNQLPPLYVRTAAEAEIEEKQLQPELRRAIAQKVAEAIANIDSNTGPLNN